MSYTYQIIIIIFLCIALAGGGYYFFYQPSDDSVNNLVQGVTGSSVATSTLDSDQNQTLQRLNKLQNIDIDAEFLSSDIFQSLENFGITIEPQSVGRSNPFQPLGVAPPADVSESSINIDFSDGSQDQQDDGPQSTSSQSTTSVDELLENDSGSSDGSGQ